MATETALNLLFVGVAAMLAKTVVDRYVAARERERPLACVTDEWRDVYLTLSQLQKADELVAPELKQVPTDIVGLQELSAVRAKGFAVVYEPFERAAKRIREQVLPHASDRSITPAESSKSMGAA